MHVGELTVKQGPVPTQREPIRRIEDCLPARDGLRLFHRSWHPPEPETALVVVHGFGEHSGRYEELASWLARRGIAVHAFDLRGHGRTPGKRGHVASFDLLLDDVATLIDRMSQEHPGLPRVLLGHSMGGLVSTAFVCERQPDIDRLVVSGPALALSPDISKGRLLLARWLRRILPRATLGAGLDSDGLSRDPDVIRRYESDPLVHGRVSASFGAGMLDAQLRTAASAVRVEVPMLLLHGEDDPLCLVQGSRDFFDGLPRDRVSGSRLRTYPGLKHEIFNEPERLQVYEDLFEWLDTPMADRSRRSPDGHPAGVR
jgi:alpha-beta hydrolase superfamily lysophospholipase